MKENIYPALLFPHVEIICLVYDLRDTKDISSGHISLDWQFEFCRTSDWQRWSGGFSWASQFNHKGKIVKQWWFLSQYYSNRRQKIVQCQQTIFHLHKTTVASAHAQTQDFIEKSWLFSPTDVWFSYLLPWTSFPFQTSSIILFHFSGSLWRIQKPWSFDYTVPLVSVIVFAPDCGGSSV